MKKKSVNLITAVGVLVVLSGAYVGVKTYVAKQDAEEAEADEEESQEIISIASDDVKSVKFVMDKKEVTLEKEHWKMWKTLLSTSWSSRKIQSQ